MTRPVALPAAEVAPRVATAAFPPDLVRRLAGREKRALGEVFGLTRFGVNLTYLSPDAASALRHAHAAQDEFVFILEGEPTLVTDAGETRLAPGMCAGFPAGTGDAHHLINRTQAMVTYLEIGDRAKPDRVTYPDDDLQGWHDPDGTFRYARKDGTPV